MNTLGLYSMCPVINILPLIWYGVTSSVLPVPV